MSLHWSDLPAEVFATLRRGTVIPAHPLALDASRRLDARRQRSLARYYPYAGACGLAVGVHPPQFASRGGLYEPVLRPAIRRRVTGQASGGDDRGPVGRVRRRNATQLACGLAFHGECLCHDEGSLSRRTDRALRWRRKSLVASPSARGGASRCRRSFAPLRLDRERGGNQDRSLQPLPTLDVVRGVVTARAEERVALIPATTITSCSISRAVRGDAWRECGAHQGGCSGTDVWTRRGRVACARQAAIAAGSIGEDPLASMRDRLQQHCSTWRTISPAAFRVATGAAAPGAAEGRWCLDPDEQLSPGQSDEIDRVCGEHADLSDDDFVRANLARWLA